MKASPLFSEAGRMQSKREGKKAPKVPELELVLSASAGRNALMLRNAMSLYVPLGAVVADVTYGRGVFWSQIPEGAYKLNATDIQTGVDCRKLPYADDSLDCVLFDPPYMHSPGNSAHAGQANYERYYRNNAAASTKKGHEAVLELYHDGAREAWRVLRPGGIYMVKCQDEVCSGRQRLTHVEIINELAKLGFVAEDVFVLMRSEIPRESRMLRQVHARKNHSYLIVFLKRTAKQVWRGVDPCLRLDRFKPGRDSARSAAHGISL